MNYLFVIRLLTLQLVVSASIGIITCIVVINTVDHPYGLEIWVGCLSAVVSLGLWPIVKRMRMQAKAKRITAVTCLVIGTAMAAYGLYGGHSGRSLLTGARFVGWDSLFPLVVFMFSGIPLILAAGFALLPPIKTHSEAIGETADG